VFGTNLAVRELGLGRPERGIVLADEVAVRSAPSDDDDLVLFEIHEGTRVRIDRRAGEWAEIVLDDGKVGWVPAAAFEEI
jgi:SH3-like domain-containing protein